MMKELTKTEENYVHQSYTEYNPLTGLYYNHAFFKRAEEYLKTVKADSFCMVAVDIEHFRLFNKIFGREQGDRLLTEIAEALNAFRKVHEGLVGYIGGDNYAALIVYERNIIEQFCNEVTAVIRRWSSTIGFSPAFGVYPITDGNVSAALMYDRAQMAGAQVLGNYLNRCCVYTSDMEEKMEKEVKLLSDVQDGLEKGEFIFFVQPQCDISSGKIVGGESLVRWKHGTEGMIPPGVFIPVLEQNGFISDLDRYVWRKVCEWLRALLDKGCKPVPISINVSRMDIFSMDVPAYLAELLKEYELPANLIKVEVTESAYAESNDKIIQAVQRLREADFLVMMDDFGSGYSSLNMLKEVSVDVLKMDMRFLDMNEDEEAKGVGILENVVNMAKQMRMPVIAEGVETQKQENLLLKMGCHYSQGYYYYKPLPIEDFEQLIADENNVDLNGLWCRQKESFRLSEFLDSNLFSDTMVNNILGPAAFYDVYENNIEVTRVNEQYYALAGTVITQDGERTKRFWSHVRDDDRQLLVSMFGQACLSLDGSSQGHIHFVRDDGIVLWVLMRIFFLREKDGHKIFYGSLMDMTSVREHKSSVGMFEAGINEVSVRQKKELEKYYGNLPCGYGVARMQQAEDEKPLDYEIIYANGELSRVSGGDIVRLKYLLKKLFEESQNVLLDKAYRAAFLGEIGEHSVYSSVSGRYLQFTFYQYQYGYVSFLMQDVTRYQIYENTMKNILLSYREVYFLHLEENYCRMIYPDDNQLIERGNYEATVNRHICMGRILAVDEEKVRNVLSLRNLRQALSVQDTVEYEYRRSVDGKGEEWCLVSFNVCERKGNLPKTAIVTIRSIESIIREKEDEKHQSMAKALANMSDGFLVYEENQPEKILYANPAVLEMFGCAGMEEFRELTGNSFSGMVYPEDLNRIQWEIREQIKHSDNRMDFIYYRIVRKDGEIRWIDDCGHLESSASENGTRLFYVFISDVTSSLAEAEKEKCIRLNEKFN